MEFFIISILLAIFICLVTAILYHALSKKPRNFVIMCGLCQSGKTALFTKLCYDKLLQSYMSIQENVFEYHVDDDNAFQLVDLPGQEKIRYEYLAKYKQSVRATLFAIDSKTIQTNIKDIAEYLYNILTDPTIVSCKPQVCIICNKQDNTMAKGAKVVRSLLERELNILRGTRAGALEDLDSKSSKSNALLLTKDGSDFSFANSKLKVDFVECSAVDNVEPLRKWLATLKK